MAMTIPNVSSYYVPDRIIKELANIVELNKLNPTYIEVFTENSIPTDTTVFTIRSILKEKGDLVYIQYTVPNYELYNNKNI